MLLEGGALIMNSKAGLWIDHRQAVIVHLSEDTVNTETIQSDMEKHVKATGGSRSSTPYGPQDVLADDRIDRKYRHHLDQYYKEVLQALPEARSMLIMGPGEAKEEFRKYFQKKGHNPMPAITIETTDKMTEAQIIAKVKQHFSN